MLAFFESFAFIGFIVPGSIAVIVGGFLAAHGSLNIKILFISVLLAAIFGDSFSFHLGRTNKINFKTENKFFKPELLTKGKEFFKKYGAKSVFLGRFIGWVRSIVPFIAGLFKLDIKIFLFWNILSGLLWSVSHIALGYFFGRSWQLVTLWSTRASIFFSIFIVFFVIFYLLKWFIVRKGKIIYQIYISIWDSVKKSILDNAEIQKIVDSHSTLFSFLRKRFDKNNFSGLPLTLFSISLLYVFALFAGIVEDLINSEIITQIDLKIENSLVLFRSTDLTSIFNWITLLGKWQVIIIFLVAASLLFWLWNKKDYILPLIISVVGSVAFTSIGKIIFHRARPAAALYKESSFSFPSGHATIAVAFYGFLAYILVKNVQKWKNKINVFFITLLLIFFIGFSRLYLGVHYFSDVWAGYLVGTIWLIIAIGFSEYLSTIRKENRNNISIKYKTVISIIIIIIAVGSYSFFAYNYQFSNIVENQEEIRIKVKSPMSVFNEKSLIYTETLLGNKQEPISFVFSAQSEERLFDLFQTAGWQAADEINIFNIYKLAKANLLNDNYSKAPTTPSFWGSRVPDFNFVKVTNANNLRNRHQIRIWKSKFVLADGSRLYMGIVSLNKEIKWGVIHQIGPDLNAEREFLFADLTATGMIKKIEKKNLVEAQTGKNFSGDVFFTDGDIYILFLK
jgi:undecaprenyl-diphosphatase